MRVQCEFNMGDDTRTSIDTTDEAQVQRAVATVRGMGGVTTARMLARHTWSMRRPGVAKAMLECLVERGAGYWINCPTGPKGGRPSRVFALAAEPAGISNG
jgi:hypothetical protein